MSALAWGIGAAAGGLLGSAYSARRAKQLSREQMRFQERMSSTAHQREVKDLRAAGLNPILSATRGGASTPPGAMPQVPDYGASLTKGFSTGLAYKRLKQELENMKEVRYKDHKLGNLAYEQSVREQAQQRKLDTETNLLKAQLPGAEAEAEFWKSLDEGASSAKGIMKFTPLLKILRGRK